MKYQHTFTLTLLTLVILLSTGISSTTAVTLSQGPDGNFDYENENVHIKVTGNENVPKYEFWSVDDTDTKYRVQFSQFFEAIDSNGDGVYDPSEDSMVSGSSLALASVMWDFSDPVNESDAVHFNITSTSLSYDLTFANHIENNSSSLKFDVIIDNYEFQSDSDDVLLVLSFTLRGGNTDDTEEPEQDDNEIGIGDDAFFQVEETAQDADGDSSVGLSTGNSGNSPRAYISYEKFNGTLIHDPTIGLDSSSNTILYIAGGTIVVVAVAAIVYLRKRQ